MSLWKGLKTKKTLGKMPVKTPTRELKEVIAEYGDLVANVGERAYKIKILEREIENLHHKIDLVQAEAAAIQKELHAKIQEDDTKATQAKAETKVEITHTQAQEQATH